LESIGFYQGSLYGIAGKLIELADSLGLEWALKGARAAPAEEEDGRSRTKWEWNPVREVSAMAGSLLLAVHPRLAVYSPEDGFRLGEINDQTWHSPARKPNKPPIEFAPYRRETLVEHAQRMIDIYDKPWFDGATG